MKSAASSKLPPRAGALAFLQNIRTLDSLRVRGYRLLWMGQMGTAMGMWMDQVTRGWLMYQLTGSAFDLGVVSALRALPMLFFGLFAGVIVDRYSRKGQLVISQTANLVLNVVLGLLVTTRTIEPWHLYASSLIAGTVQTFQQPARQTMIYDLVGKDRLINAISLSSAAVNLARSIGPMVAGALIAVVGIDGSYYVQALVYAWATVWTMQIPLSDGGRTRRESEAITQVSFFSSFREGMAYVVKNQMILSLMLLGLVPMLLAMPYMSLFPVFTVDVLHTDSFGQGLLTMSVGVGALLGAVGLASLGKVQKTGYFLLGGVALFGLSLVAFSRSELMAVSLLFLFAAGLSNVAYHSQAQSAIQMLAPARLRGRVVSVYLLDRALMPLGSMLAGTLATVWGGPAAVTLMGASCCVLGIAIAIWMPHLRNLDLAEEALHVGE